VDSRRERAGASEPGERSGASGPRERASQGAPGGEAPRTRVPRAGSVSLIGRPNAGKSTLLNLIVGTKVAIVSDKPQTTRNRILAVKHRDDGQLVFVDTPGIHRPLHRMNVRMVDAAVETLREMDVIALVFDASTRPGRGDEYVSNLLTHVTRPVVLVLNKIDLVTKSALLPLMARAATWHDFAAIVPVSAATGDGVDRLERVLLDQMPEGDPLFPDDYLTDQPERAMAAEMVREKVLVHTRAELPFSTAVAVDEFDESERDHLLRIYCTIFVEQESQKPIVIGRGGEMIKRIGTEARQDLERFFDTKVFLDLRVKVNPDWRNDERTLDELGVPKRTTKPKRKR
jgi:GTPase